MIKRETTVIGGTNDWTVTITDGLAETPEHQSKWVHRKAGIKDWTASIEANLDITAAEQTPMMQMILGATATATFRFYVNATTYLNGPGYLSFDMGVPSEDKQSITFNIVGDGILASSSIEEKIDIIDGYHDVPVQGATTNNQARDVTGNKTDPANETADEASLVALIRAILADVTGVAGVAMRGTDDVPTNPMLDIEDGLSFTAIPDMATASELAKVQSSRDFWSAVAPVAETTISTTQATKVITPTIVVPSGAHGIPSGATIDCVHILAKWRQTEDSSGADNAIDNIANTMQLQIDDAGNTGWLTAYSFADNSYFVDGDVYSIGAGDVVEGITDIKSRVDGADTYDIQLLNTESDGDFLIFRDFMWGLRIWWH